MRNVKTSIIMLALGSLVLLNACNAQDEKRTNDAVLATVNGSPIYQSQQDQLMRQGLAQGAPDSPETRKVILDELISREVARQDAVKQGLEKRPEVKQQVEQASHSILINAFMQEFIKTHTPTEDQLKAEYDKVKAQIGDKQYDVRHILVKTEKEAKDIIAQLNKGVKFEKLASKSLDKGSAARGGDLGFNPPSAFVPPFAKAIESLKKGETTKTPVQTQFGWHVIRVEDIKPAPSFEEVKKNLAPRVQQEELRKYIEDLRTKSKIEYKTVQAPAATPAPAAPAAPAAANGKK
jgi:peptidyl-prolyl cis-trans isomerase C